MKVEPSDRRSRRVRLQRPLGQPVGLETIERPAQAALEREPGIAPAQGVDGLRRAPAIETLDARLAGGEAGQYDFAFVDADKTSYDAYYERCLQLLRPGGLMAIDNTLWSGKVAHPADGDAATAALQALNAKLHVDARIDVSLLPIGDGLTLARKR